jgi:hypothetical protein
VCAWNTLGLEAPAVAVCCSHPFMAWCRALQRVALSGVGSNVGSPGTMCFWFFCCPGVRDGVSHRGGSSVHATLPRTCQPCLLLHISICPRQQGQHALLPFFAQAVCDSYKSSFDGSCTAAMACSSPCMSCTVRHWTVLMQPSRRGSQVLSSFVAF